MLPQYYTANDFVPLNDFSYNSFDGSITFDIKHMQEDMYRQILGITNNTKKETEKMEAKKCDRCGKLYEIPTADENGNGAEVRFKTGRYDSDTVDLCPDCRKSLKKWFEGVDKEDKKA